MGDWVFSFCEYGLTVTEGKPERSTLVLYEYEIRTQVNCKMDSWAGFGQGKPQSMTEFDLPGPVIVINSWIIIYVLKPKF